MDSIQETPHLCECGCGQAVSRHGRKYRRFITGHNAKPQQPIEPPNPSGFCMCGCGQRTKIAKQSCTRQGYVIGQPLRYIHNHNNGQAQPVKRFWANVDTSGGPDACWPWTGFVGPNGYGQIRVNRRAEMAHRYCFILHNGPLLHGEQVCHSCDNRVCCNARHLFKGDQQANMTDKVNKGRQAKGERVGTSKLTDDQVREIRARYAAGGISQAALAAEYGVHQHPIWEIVTGNSWKHIL
jgi:hypothetical protein